MNNTYIKNFLLWLFPSIISGSFLLQAFLTSPSTALTPAFLSHKKRTQRHLLNTNRFLVRNFKIENRVMASYSSFSSDDTSVVVDRLPVAISNKESSSISVITTTTATNSSTESGTTDILISDEKPLFQQLEEKSLRAALNVLDTSPKIFNSNPWIVGHRGCLYQELENTREGFQKCAKMGIDAVELDVFLLKCGSLIVFHGGGTDENPGDLLDYCGVEGSILDLTYEQASKLSFNPSHDEFGCPDDITLKGSIPTLQEVLMDMKKCGLHVKIELKGEGTVEPTLELVECLGMTSQCSYSSFALDRIAHLRKLRPDRKVYPTGALFDKCPDDFIRQAQEAGATEVHLRYDFCTQENIKAIHQAGLGSMAWFRGPIGMASDCKARFLDVGNEDESMYDVMLRTGVQRMCINKPDILLGLRERLARGP